MLDMLQRLTQGRSFSSARPHPSGLAHAARVLPPAHLGGGYEDAYLSSPEFIITAKRIEARRTFWDDEPGLGRLVFIFHLQGRRIIQLGGDQCELNGPTFAVYYQAEGLSKRSTWAKGEQETAVVIGFWPQDPPAALRVPDEQAGEWHSVFPTANQRFLWLQRPLSLEMEQAAHLILAPRVHPAALSNLLVAKANELLCLGFDSLLCTRANGAASAVRSKLEEVRQTIDATLRAVPSNAALARGVGLSPADLSLEFQRAFQCSIPEYIVERRMLLAQHLLVSSDKPLKQIAYEVGYNHTSNFCSAFKRHFGKTAHRQRLSAASERR